MSSLMHLFRKDLGHVDELRWLTTSTRTSEEALTIRPTPGNKTTIAFLVSEYRRELQIWREQIDYIKPVHQQKVERSLSNMPEALKPQMRQTVGLVQRRRNLKRVELQDLIARVEAKKRHLQEVLAIENRGGFGAAMRRFKQGMYD
jgi:DNA/RNA endonuclease YhcR with UshA esterase domain